MTDIHCHILPTVDDGSRSWEMSVEMCSMAYADGIRHIIATPHANYRYPYSRPIYEEALEQLREKTSGLTFTLGCDFNLSQSNIDDAVAHPERYVIGGTSYLLVEFDDFQTPHQMTDNLFRLHSAGFVTIVTHPERNAMIDQYPDLPTQFADMGSAIQITANALTGDWGRKARKTAESLLKKGLVTFIASDAHDSKRRVPILSAAQKAAAKIIGQVEATALVLENPGVMLANQLLAEEYSPIQ